MDVFLENSTTFVRLVLLQLGLSLVHKLPRRLRQSFFAGVNTEVEEECSAGQEVDLDEEGDVEQPMKKQVKVEQEGSAEEEEDEEEEGSAKEFPTGLPMEYEYHDKSYYVHECFPEYYELVMYLFEKEKKRGVTITGTPGIGKSIFMAYFFQRYSEKYPDATVLIASYAEGSGESAGEHNIRLLDGAPTKIPKATRWVSFTSPNEDWEKELANDTSGVAKVIMPVWTQDELRDAASKLGRKKLLEPISDRLLKRIGADPADIDTSRPRPATIDVCFGIFEGVPRVCVETNDDELVRLVKSMDRAVSRLTIRDICSAMADGEVPVLLHRFLHYVPLEQSAQRPQQYRLATVRIASAAIDGLLAKRHQDGEENTKTGSEQIARYIPEMETYGYSIEAKAVRLLKSGCTIKAKNLHT